MLSESGLKRVAQSCVWRHYDAQAQILAYQEPSTDVYFLLAGKARVIIYSADGKGVVVRLGSGCRAQRRCGL